MLQPRNVLIADPSRYHGSALAQYVESCGYFRAKVVQSTEYAFDLFVNGPVQYTTVITEINFSNDQKRENKSGVELAKALRQEKGHAVRILARTNVPLADDEKHAFNLILEKTSNHSNVGLALHS